MANSAASWEGIISSFLISILFGISRGLGHHFVSSEIVIRLSWIMSLEMGISFPYNVSSTSIFSGSETVSLPMFHVRGAMTCDHWQTKGSLQYGAPLPFFQCWAQAQDALDGRSACLGPLWWGFWFGSELEDADCWFWLWFWLCTWPWFKVATFWFCNRNESVCYEYIVMWNILSKVMHVTARNVIYKISIDKTINKI